MISILDLLPLIALFSIGYFTWKGINKIFPTKARKTELYNIFLIFGTFILIFPLMIIGIQDEGVVKLTTEVISITIINFRGWTLLYFILGLLFLSGSFLLRSSWLCSVRLRLSSFN